MANQYTAGAYMGVKPVTEDFGDDALKSYEIVMQQNAMKIAERKQKAAEAKAAQERLNSCLKDMDQLVAQALSIQPMSFDQDMLNDAIPAYRNEVIEALRIASDPASSPADVIMAKTKVRMMSQRAIDYVKDRESVISFIKSFENVDTEDGWDGVLSAPAMDGILRAIHSAGDKGAKKNEDGSLSVGDYMTQKMGPNGMMITLKTADLLGEDITGTYSEIAAKLASKMHKTVNEQKDLWDYAGKDVQSRAREFYRNAPGGLIEIIKQDNWAEIDRMIGDDFDARFPDAKSTKDYSPILRKLIAQGSYKGRDEIRQAYILAGRNRVKSENNLQLKNDPAYLNEYKRWQMSQKSNDDLYNAFLDRSQAVLSGDTDAISSFGSDKLISLPGGRVAAVSIAGRKGDDFIFKAIESVVGKDGKTSARNAEDIVYDMRTESGRKAAMGILTQMYNSSHEGKEGSLLETEVDKRVDYTQSPYSKIEGEGLVLDKNTEKKLGAIEEKLKGKEQLKTDELNSILSDLKKELKNVGYNLNIDGSWFGKWGNMEITIEDEDGNSVLEIAEKSGDEVAQKLRDFIRDLMGHSSAPVNPAWLRRGANPGQSPVNVSYAKSGTQRGGNVGGVPKF